MLSFNFTESRLLIDSALPPIIQSELQVIDDVSLQQLNDTPSARMYATPAAQDGFSHMESSWPSYISDASLVPWIGVYFDRLHATIPVLNRNAIFTRILGQEHRHNPLLVP